MNKLTTMSEYVNSANRLFPLYSGATPCALAYLDELLAGVRNEIPVHDKVIFRGEKKNYSRKIAAVLSYQTYGDFAPLLATVVANEYTDLAALTIEEAQAIAHINHWLNVASADSAAG